MDTKNVKKLREDIVFWEYLLGNKFVFHTTWGLFSPKEVDDGSKLLLKCLEKEILNEGLKVLDLGCGYGALGIPVAKQLPFGTVHMVDKDFVAVGYAKKNAEINFVKNGKIYLSNGFDGARDTEFDIIVSNLPAKMGKELFWLWLHDAKKFLKPNGKLYVVTISGLKEFIKRNLQEEFGNYEKMAQNKNYTVAMAIKTHQ